MSKELAGFEMKVSAPTMPVFTSMVKSTRPSHDGDLSITLT